MPAITGTVLRKKHLPNKKKSQLFVIDEFQDTYAFQVRNSELSKLVEVNDGDSVKVYYRNELSEKHAINNLILKDLKVI